MSNVEIILLLKFVITCHILMGMLWTVILLIGGFYNSDYPISEKYQKAPFTLQVLTLVISTLFWPRGVFLFCKAFCK